MYMLKEMIPPSNTKIMVNLNVRLFTTLVKTDLRLTPPSSGCVLVTLSAVILYLLRQ
jgi:hypothetical protein